MIPRISAPYSLSRSLARPLLLNCSRRQYVNYSNPKAASIAVAPLPVTPSTAPSAPQPPIPASPLATLPLTNIIRTYLITRISSSPLLWGIFFRALQQLATPRTALLDPDKNRALNWLLKKTFYSQFCAGENGAEIARTTKSVKSVGYHGIILEYALEVLLDGIENGPVPGPDSVETKREIEAWRRGMLQTVEMAGAGEFAALKWSGLGRHALHLLKQNQPPTPRMAAVIQEVCDAAAAKDLALLPGAEEEVTNAGIDTWTLALEARYNNDNSSARGARAPGTTAIMYNTYQAYLRSTPAKLAAHLAHARAHNYTAGVKLVRGAYLASEPRGAVWPTKAGTDAAYNALAEALLRRRYNDVLRAAPGEEGNPFPQVALVLATHNRESVLRAQAVRDEQAAAGAPRIPRLAYAQLMGMADEVGAELVQAARIARAAEAEARQRQQRPGAEEGGGPLWRKVDVPKAYKCLCWGTAGECLQFLLRRAAENKDAATRTATTRRAMAGELRRRVRVALGLA